MDEKIFSGIYDAESRRIAADSLKARLNDLLWGESRWRNVGKHIISLRGTGVVCC